MSADFTPEKEDLKILTPFKMQVLTNFPYIEADFDALTNYQLLCKVVENLNAVITETNEVTEQTLSLYNAFVSLQNYVNTYLDVNMQAAINAKLDEMATDGTFYNLVAQYVQNQALICFNNINDMKEATNIVNGSFVKTYGFNAVYDGGGALYKISNDSSLINNGKTIHELDNGLKAVLVFDTKYFDIRKIGVFPDTGNVKSVDLYNAISIINENKCIPFIPKGTYIVKSKEIDPSGSLSTFGLVIPENSDVYFEKGAIIKLINDAESWSRVIGVQSNVNIYGELTIDGSCATVTDGNEHMAGLFIYDKNNIYIEKLNSLNCYGDNVQISGETDGYGNIFIGELYCKKAGRKNLVFESGHNVHIHNAILDNTEGDSTTWTGGNSLDVEPLSSSYTHDLTIDRIETFGTGNDFTAGQTIDRANSCILNFGTFIQHGGELVSFAMTVNADNMIFYNGDIDILYAAVFNINNLIFYEQDKKAFAIAGVGANIPIFNINNLEIHGTSSTTNLTNPCCYIESSYTHIKNCFIENYYYLTLSFYANLVAKTNCLIDNLTLKNCGYSTGASDTNSLILCGYYTNCEQNVYIRNITNYETREQNLPNSVVKMMQTKENQLFIVDNVINYGTYPTINTRYDNFTPILQYGGNTEQRPTNVYKGLQYYDITLNKIIMYNGSAWVNLDGSSLE